MCLDIDVAEFSYLNSSFNIEKTDTSESSFLPVLFVAPIVSLLDCWDQLKSHLIPIVLILIGSTVLCFAVSGRITQWYVGRKEKKDD